MFIHTFERLRSPSLLEWWEWVRIIGAVGIGRVAAIEAIAFAGFEDQIHIDDGFRRHGRDDVSNVGSGGVCILLEVGISNGQGDRIRAG